MSDPFVEGAAVVPSDYKVQVTLQAGPYQADKIVIAGDSVLDVLNQFDDALAKLTETVAKAGASFIRFAEVAEQQRPAAAGQYGKPAGANTASNTELPFANAEIGPSDPTKCEHGDRSLVEGGGKKGWICSVPKGQPGRCETIFV
jgi:hypothetical protein